MRAVLMAGGAGTRLRPLTCDLPKPMVPILNRPIAEHVVQLLKRHEITEIIATLHYMPDVLRDYFQDGSDFGVQMTYAVEEDKPLGTAGCVQNVADCLDQTFLVISGDCITNFDLSAAIAFHHQKRAKATLLLARVPNPMEFGMVITDDDGSICRFLEKPTTGEIFSDTVSAGIYILEPEVLDYLSPNQASDFSKDLFPRLLAWGEPLYGYIDSGYWCDIGHLNSYRETQYDALRGEVRLDPGYDALGPGIWVGQNTRIHPSAHLKAPILIGDNCRIGPRAFIEAGTVIGDNVTVCADANLKRPIVWNGAILGEEAHLRACVIGRGVRVDRRAHVMEGAVVGSLSQVGEEAQISPAVRVWPSKQIESGASLSINLIWGHIAHRNLFSQGGVAGLANVDITPEFAVKLGAAYGSILKPGSQVMVSRDQRSISRMVSRSLIAGLMSVGVHVRNLEATAIPISRAVIPTLSVVGGIHVRIHPHRSDSILVEFFDARGINISTAQEKRIEGAYLKEDIRRAQIHEIGSITNYNQSFDLYSQTFGRHIKLEAQRIRKTKVVIDYAYSAADAVLPRLLANFDCDAVVLNASLRQAVVSPTEKEELLVQLGHVVEALRASFGVQVAANGEQLILVDETGTSIREETLTALVVSMVLKANPQSTVVVPIYVSSAIEAIARRHDATVIRTKTNPTALMEACHVNPNVVLGGSSQMGFIFPQLHPGFDAMFCIAKLIEMLTWQGSSLEKIRTDLPQVCHRYEYVRCSWARKGALMRHLVESNPAINLELIDGVKIRDEQSDNWVLILPDAGDPLVHIYVNSTDRHWADQTLKFYRSHIEAFTRKTREA